MEGGGSSSDRFLTETPTWEVAAVFFALVVHSLLLELGIHHASHVIFFFRLNRISFHNILFDRYSFHATLVSKKIVR